MSSHGTFATVLGCMDGRCQEKTIAYAKKLFGVDHIDTITEPGMDKILAGGTHAAATEEFLPQLREWIQKKTSISAKGHGSTQVLVTGHCSCAGNPVDFDQHTKDIKAAIETVHGWNLFIEIKGAAFDEQWEIKEM
ncbi:MAG TPA: carbonic anhydrase [Candidatus Paceibacterota bacterium]|nr:carbonic anhydrase [Candidatus Paceibacterota bacterium]